MKLTDCKYLQVTTSIYNLILGKLYCDHYGTMRIQGNREYSCKLKFKEQSIIDRNPHQVQGVVQDRSGRTIATLFGKWDESMHYVMGDCFGKGKGSEQFSEAHLLWKRSKPPKFPTRYNLTRFAITLNELTPGLKEKLPPTDSRLRPDQRCLENGEYERANAEKLRLEQRQRQKEVLVNLMIIMNHKILLKRLMMMRTFTSIPETFYHQALLKAVDLIFKDLKVVQMMKMIIQWMELILP